MRLTTTDNDLAIAKLRTALRRGPSGVAHLASLSGLTGRSVLRLLKQNLNGDFKVVTAGLASRTQYGLAQDLRGDISSMPLYAVDEGGGVSHIADLSLLQPQGSHCDLGACWPVDRAAASREGWWDGLPYPIYDMQPHGYLGRALARTLHETLNVSINPRDWDDSTIAYVLSRQCPDNTGNLILGDLSLKAFQQQKLHAPELIAQSDAQLVSDYVLCAQMASSHGLAASSAAGEFPKFTARRVLKDSQTPHVIVKFSGNQKSGEAAQRWSDLLCCEALALQAASKLAGLSVAATRVLFESSKGVGRTFLESERFDRVGLWGRRSMVSLHSAAAHLHGQGEASWPVHAQALFEAGLLDETEIQTTARLWWFGQLIGNTDMHLGNLSLFVVHGEKDKRPRFKLAPLYDMLPMTYAPLAGGEVPAQVTWSASSSKLLPLPREREIWLQAHTAACAFWQSAASGVLPISSAFQKICAANLEALIALHQAV